MPTESTHTVRPPGGREFNPSEGYEGVVIGELSGKTADISDRITKMKVSYTADLASEISFTVYDPELKFHNAGYFVIRREVRFDGSVYEVSSVSIVNDDGNSMVEVKARSKAIQQLKREKGATNFGAISPTTLASQRATALGLKFFGESSAVKSSILRQQSENVDESTWDVLRRLARDLEFVVFETSGILFFTSEKFAVSKQPFVNVAWPSPDYARYHCLEVPNLSRSDDDPLGATMSLVLNRPNSVNLRPGMGIALTGIRYFDNARFMVTDVDYEIGSPEPVSVKGRTTEVTEDVGCEKRTFAFGAQSECVGRFQLALGLPQTNLVDGRTTAAVRVFQAANGLPVNGVVNPAVWAKLIAT